MLVTYDLTGLSASKKSLVSKYLAGYVAKSHGAKYVYQKKGILDELIHLRIRNGIIVSKKNSKKIMKIIKSKGGKTNKIPLKISKRHLKCSKNTKK